MLGKSWSCARTMGMDSLVCAKAASSSVVGHNDVGLCFWWL